MTIVSAEIFVMAHLKMAYRAFTNSTSLREWLCDVATTEPHVGGRIYLWWRGDFYSSGHYLELTENRNIKFKWYSNIDPAATEVNVVFTEKDGGTLVHIDHHVPDDDSWKKIGDGFRENWQDSLRNLRSVLETGIDLRISERPMLGIAPGDFTEEQAKALGVPVREGLRLDGTVAGMGAEKAGLKQNDVIVGMAGNPITSDFNSLPLAIAGKKGGDVIEVVFYRGAEKKTVNMELTKRPVPDVPFNAQKAADIARDLFEVGLDEVEKCFEGVTDQQAMKRPAEGEWSALEVLAHLIQNERFQMIYLVGLVDGYESVADGFGTNVDAYVRATVKANPSVALMLSALRRTVDELLAFVAALPDDFVANKGSFYRFVGFSLLQPNFHLSGHTQQIKEALASARK